MDVSFQGKYALAMASEDVKSYAGDQIGLRVKAELLGPAAFVGQPAIEGQLGRRMLGHSDV
jgi:hypothetical protein